MARGLLPWMGPETGMVGVGVEVEGTYVRVVVYESVRVKLCSCNKSERESVGCSSACSLRTRLIFCIRACVRAACVRVRSRAYACTRL
jgi:hypothetical protein